MVDAEGGGCDGDVFVLISTNKDDVLKVMKARQSSTRVAQLVDETFLHVARLLQEQFLDALGAGKEVHHLHSVFDDPLPRVR